MLFCNSLNKYLFFKQKIKKINVNAPFSINMLKFAFYLILFAATSNKHDSLHICLRSAAERKKKWKHLLFFEKSGRKMKIQEIFQSHASGFVKKIHQAFKFRKIFSRKRKKKIGEFGGLKKRKYVNLIPIK